MSTVWRYTAIERAGARRTRVGELAGDSGPEVRAALRRIGLQVIELRPVRAPYEGSASRNSPLNSRSRWQLVLQAQRQRACRHLRTRRRTQRADLFDALATMLESGLPLLEAVDTLIASPGQELPGGIARLSSRLRSRSPLRIMLVGLRQALRDGSSLDDVLAAYPSWFDETEVAMVRAAQHAGNLAPVLRRLAEQHERAGELGHKLASALAYPMVIAAVGIAVAIFLSLKTLPDLSRILQSAGIEVPALTQHVMDTGQFVASWWPLLLLLGALAAAALIMLPMLQANMRLSSSTNAAFVLSPIVVRRMAVAGFSLRFSELLRTGVPVVESLRVLVPTVSSTSLRALLAEAADRVERGDDLSESLDDARWFDAEYRRLLEIGQASGELDTLLARIGARYERSARRQIDRLAALLEPLVILTLAALIGVVAMAAVLPLTRLQEVLR